MSILKKAIIFLITFIILDVIFSVLFVICGPYETYGTVASKPGINYPCGKISLVLLKSNIQIFSFPFIFFFICISLIVTYLSFRRK